MAKLQVTELDFDDIKENLKTYLKAQTKFKDYDFEGSGMNVLLDTLAYNTHYLAFNANMVANEMFLDSASLRSSVVSHAKQLGYEVCIRCGDKIANEESIRKSKCIAPLFNKGAYQYIGNIKEAKYIGR